MLKQAYSPSSILFLFLKSSSRHSLFYNHEVPIHGSGLVSHICCRSLPYQGAAKLYRYSHHFGYQLSVDHWQFRVCQQLVLKQLLFLKQLL